MENQNEKKSARVPDVVEKLETDIQDICNIYINNLDDPHEIYENNGLFVDMLKYIYRVYIGDLIGNKDNTYIRYDYNLLDKVFNIYTSLVYKYKQNKRCSILEFSLFTHVNRQTLYNVINGYSKNLTSNDIDMVKRWFQECENQLTNGGSVFEIFLLKSQYRYNDNLSPIPIENQGSTLAINELPDLSSGKDPEKVAKIAKKDK